MSFSDSVSDLFALANLRRAVEGGDPSAIKIAAAMFGGNAAPALPAPGGSSPAPGSLEPGTGSDANNQTASQNAYIPNMARGAYGAPVEKPDNTAFSPIKPIGDKPKTTSFKPGNYKVNTPADT